MTDISFANHFLLSMPKINDHIFSNSLIYVCEHSKRGAMGIIINKPSGIAVWQLFEQISLEMPTNEIGVLPVLFGGPIQAERGFVLHSPHGNWQSSLLVTDDLALTTSKDVLSAVASETSPTQIIAALGYSGWEPGQLEEEIIKNHWLTVPATKHILFEVPPIERYHAAMSLLGINPLLLSNEAGHA